MSGRISLAVLFLFACFGSPMIAQFLPDVNQFEVENARLILLDGSGQRKGVLKGDTASKQRDGNVSIKNAELIVERDEDSFVISAESFVYDPKTNKFECEKGLTAMLPDGGEMVIPKCAGEFHYADGVLLKMQVDGQASLRSGPDGSELVDAKIADAVIELRLIDDPKTAVMSPEKQKTRLALGHLTVTGSRGGELKLRLEHLPSVGTQENKETGVASVSCFGDVALKILQGGTRADLHMLRRARMALESDDRKFEVSSNQLDIRGNIVRKPRDVPADEQKDAADKTAGEATSLTDIAIDAYENVHIAGDEFDGAAAVLRYREFGDRREVRLEGIPTLTMQQEPTPDGTHPRLEMRSKEYIDVQIPQGVTDGLPTQIATELFESANVKRFIDDRLEWQIHGRLVRLFSVLDESNGREGAYNHTFDAFAEGYSPLLRVSGLQPQSGTAPEVQRAAVYGARAKGSFIAGRAEVRVFGPDVLGVVHSNAPLAELLRVSLGLQAPHRDANNEVIPPPPRDGRLTVRASKLLDLDIVTYGGDGDLSLTAEGNVELDHEALPRDDANMVTLTGQFAGLSIMNGSVRYAQLDASDNADALATVGYDLLICRGIFVDEREEGLGIRITGPGRIVVRNETSVEYFRRQLDRLPKRPDDSSRPPQPDAAWLNFGESFTSRVGDLQKQLEADSPDFRLVYGDFERPRAGRSSIKDLAELNDPEVQQLYEIHGRRVFVSSTRKTLATPSVNVLLLEGDAYVNSRIDGITARASGAIELSGSDNQRASDAPLSVVLRRNAEIEIEDAGVFFGEYVQGGVFSYDGNWLLESAERLEITFRPIESPGDDPTLIPRIREALSKAQEPRRPMQSRLQQVERAAELLETAASTKRPTRPGADQPWKAAAEARDAVRYMRTAMHMFVAGLPEGPWRLQNAMRSVRRCRALLAALIDVAGTGRVQGHFRSTETDVPPLDLSMRQALFTFDGLGQIVDVAADGPIEISRASYSLRGTRLHRESDGTLTLDGASITLPADTGVEVGGVETISLKQREGKTFGTEAHRQRTMVTRVSGKKVQVAIKIGQK